MSATRNNHYVPRWYQAGFLEPGRTTLAYLDLNPPQKTLNDGRIITGNSLVHWPSARCFQQRDLYSTFFGTFVDDEIERRLFGNVDAKGASAVRAFADGDVGEWHRHFETFFQYIDIQKIRTPKGLDWLRAQYPALTQNELMFEMQGIRALHCTIWAEGVREIVSAEESEIKFIVSDHPVTIYNHAVVPDNSLCAYPLDPSIALKGSQTIFPLSRDCCLIFTNLEYAQDSATNPLERRTFARNYRSSMVRTDAFIRVRKLSTVDVARVNRIIRARARRYIAAGRKEWLHPDENESWAEIRHVLLPPKDELYHYGGELFAKFEDGRVHYQDAFGRTEKEHDWLKKAVPTKPMRSSDWCGCGSGRIFESCCESKPTALRPSWIERSIRERNIMLFNALHDVVGLDQNMDWVKIRYEMTDEKIKTIYRLFAGLWPTETDLLQLLPKPDGTARAVYTGVIHPSAITEYALGASLYFGELIIQHPFVNARILRPEYSPVENPSSYRQEVLKALVLFLTLIPLVERGLVNLIPDPCDFDVHLRDQMLHMARSRSVGFDKSMFEDDRVKAIAKKESERSIMAMPSGIARSQMRKVFPDKDDADLDQIQSAMLRLRENDPLAVLQEEPFPNGERQGYLNAMKMQPNFEMALYLAQATGSSIVTDSPLRWREILMAAQRPSRTRNPALPALRKVIASSTFAFPHNVADVLALSGNESFGGYQSVMRDTQKYLVRLGGRGPKPNVEQNLAARFGRTHAAGQAIVRKAGILTKDARVSALLLQGGIQDNNVNRLLLMSSSERHLPNVPMAFFIEAASGDRPKK